MCDLIRRQDAIDAHYEYCNKHPDAGFPVWSLKILEDLPPAQPDLSGYSDKLWKAAYERGKAEAQPDLDEVYAHAETEAEARYHAERKKGKWINVRHDNIAECNQCGITGRAWMNFCFDCGADMRAERITDDR